MDRKQSVALSRGLVTSCVRDRGRNMEKGDGNQEANIPVRQLEVSEHDVKIISVGT